VNDITKKDIVLASTFLYRPNGCRK